MCKKTCMCKKNVTAIRRAASALAGITFHCRTARRTASVLAVAALLLTMAPRADAALTVFPGLTSATVDFFRLTCVSTTGDFGSDEPYVFFVVGNLVTGDLVVTRTTIFGGVDAGQSRDQTVRLWGPNGVALSFPGSNPGNLVILVGPMEHDNSDVAKLLSKLQSSLQSRFLTLRSQLGSITRSQLVTELATTMAIQEQSGGTGLFPNADDIIARPVELRITSTDVSAGDVVKTLDLAGDGFYRASFRIQSNALTFTRVGTFELTPSEAIVTVRKQARLGYVFTWTVPEGQVWRDLQTVDLRIGDELDPLLWVRFTEADGSLGLVDAATGEVAHSGSPGENNRLQTSEATVYLAKSLVQGSGPTGRSVTLILSLSFKPSAAGRAYPVEARAVDNTGNEHGFEPAGTLTVVK